MHETVFYMPTTKMNHLSYYLLLLFSLYLVSFCVARKDNQITNLNKLMESRRSENPPRVEPWTEQDISNLSPLYIVPQQGSKEADRIDTLPGQPRVDFDHYSGYVTVDADAGRALFYYFAESPQNSSTNPLVLWLNGGPGASSFGYGAMEELGPFRVNSDGKTLYRNDYAWNNVANVLFLESPAGVGFSYSNTSSDYDTGDKKTARDTYTFLINWLERFPQYKTRDFFITGESYAGHYVPQLASLILSENKKSNATIINLRGIAIGNALIDENTCYEGMYDYVTGNYSEECYKYHGQSGREIGDIDIYNIYAPFCDDTTPKSRTTGSVMNFDPCSDDYVNSYLNRADVQEALHARNTSWAHLGPVWWTESPTSILPTITQLIEYGVSVWIYSGDMDGRVPVTSSRYAVNTLKLPIETAWRPWYNNQEVGGYLICGRLQRSCTGHSKMRRAFSPKLPASKSIGHDLIIPSGKTSSIFDIIS